MEDEKSLAMLLEAFTARNELKILVHGGGRTATDVAGRLGLETKMVGGRRVTDKDMIDVVTMVYGGLVNKRVVARLQALGCNALGLTGADIDIIRSVRRSPEPIDFGYVGDVEAVRCERVKMLLEAGITPVFAPLTHDGKGQMLNTNADTIASEVAKAMASCYDVTLAYCFEHPGVLQDAANPDSVIARIDRHTFAALAEDGTVSGGMLPKIENCLRAVEAGVSRVVITNVAGLASLSGTIVEADNI